MLSTSHRKVVENAIGFFRFCSYLVIEILVYNIIDNNIVTLVFISLVAYNHTQRF